MVVWCLLLRADNAWINAPKRTWFPIRHGDHYGGEAKQGKGIPLDSGGPGQIPRIHDWLLQEDVESRARGKTNFRGTS